MIIEMHTHVFYGNCRGLLILERPSKEMVESVLRLKVLKVLALQSRECPSLMSGMISLTRMALIYLDLHEQEAICIFVG